MRILLNIENHMCICQDTCITIVNSSDISDQDIPRFIYKLRKEINKNKKLKDRYKRTDKSWIKEWIAHNRLYRRGLFIEHTRDVDLDENESKLRLLGYNIIGINNYGNT